MKSMIFKSKLYKIYGRMWCYLGVHNIIYDLYYPDLKGRPGKCSKCQRSFVKYNNG